MSNGSDWQKIELITSAEQHFNDLCFKIRTLASTWILATFAGAGFVATNTLEAQPGATQLIYMICLAGATGVFILWILDLQIYQRFLNQWFQCRAPIEKANPAFPQIHQRLIATQPGGRASSLITFFYAALCNAPMVLFVISGRELLLLNKKAATADHSWLAGLLEPSTTYQNPLILISFAMILLYNTCIFGYWLRLIRGAKQSDSPSEVSGSSSPEKHPDDATAK